ncbi:MAG: alpha/beta fold hydrolase [Burkholderiales bacterium]|nr:alpha/beta fold hydrolase [Burkholderiales bacterium]
MRASTRRIAVAGPVGRIECAIDVPSSQARGVALVAHPHPLYGGTLDNKVVQSLARAFVDLGYAAVRPNFRGVGATEGEHDAGAGEVDDLAAVLAHARAEFGAAPTVLAGFSFGAAMQVLLAQRLAPDEVARLVLVGLAVTRIALPAVPRGTLVIHGERDETVALGAVLDWARPQDLPVVVVPGADHFFHRRLQTLRDIVRGAWGA